MGLYWTLDIVLLLSPPPPGMANHRPNWTGATTLIFLSTISRFNIVMVAMIYPITYHHCPNGQVPLMSHRHPLPMPSTFGGHSFTVTISHPPPLKPYTYADATHA